MIGKRLGQYEITEKIGEGGMGEVFRARDTVLGREAALKFLQPELAADPERLARFRNEAKVLAALNHPNIAAIHGLEEADGLSFLAMEYVEGEDISARLDNAPLPLDEALDLARQLAEGLEAAHERGIIHRDLKPSNLRITPEGQLKILDFGLARRDDGPDSTDVLNSPTLTVAYTKQGVIMGTAAYMSPEQARGRKVDHRTDIWSFGTILYEMLTGQRLFSGETVSDLVAAVLRADLGLENLPSETPTGVHRLLNRCLERDARRRLRDIGEARVRLERWRDNPDTLHETTLSSTDFTPERPRRGFFPWVIAGLAIGAALIMGWQSTRYEPAPPVHTEWTLEVPGEDEIPTTRVNVLLSPDGEWCGWITNEGIRLRRVNSNEITLLPETRICEAACFSPDSRWLAFISRGGVYRVSVEGGTPFRLGDTALTRGLAWVDDNTLVLTDGIATGLQALNIETGISQVVTTPDSTRHERSHRWPTVVPGHRGVVFECQFLGRDYDNSDIDYVDLDTGKRHTLMRGGAMPQARAAGHLLFTRSDVIYAVGLDLKNLTVNGLPVPVREGVVARVGNQEDDDGSAQFALDRLGNLLYMDTMGVLNERSQLAWLDFADGTIDPISDYGIFGTGKLSPDGQKLAVLLHRNGDWNIFVRDLVSGNEQKLTSRPSVEYMGAWSPDSRLIYWTQGSSNGARFDLWSRPADGSLPESFVAAPPGIGGVWVDDVTPDGNVIGVASFVGSDRFDVLTVDLTQEPAASTLLVGGPNGQRDMKFDDSGRYFFYVEGAQFSREDEASGGNLLLRRYPDTGAVWSMPNPGGGLHTWIWSATLGGVVAVQKEGIYLLPVNLDGDTPEIGAARQLMDLRTHPDTERVRGWYLHPGGDRAVVSVAEPRASGGPNPSLVLVTGWDDVVARKLREAGD